MTAKACIQGVDGHDPDLGVDAISWKGFWHQWNSYKDVKVRQAQYERQAKLSIAFA